MVNFNHPPDWRLGFAPISEVPGGDTPRRSQDSTQLFAVFKTWENHGKIVVLWDLMVIYRDFNNPRGESLLPGSTAQGGSGSFKIGKL